MQTQNGKMEQGNARAFLDEYGIPLGLIAITIPLIPFSGFRPVDVAQELLTRLGRDTVLVLALLPMLHAGMGFNFALGVGTMAAVIGMTCGEACNLAGLPGLVFATLSGLPLAAFLGWISGRILNRAKGMEMIVSLLIGFLGNGLHQFLVLCNASMVLSVATGALQLKQGHRIQRIACFDGRHQTLDQLFSMRLGPFTFPIGTYLIVAAATMLILWFLHTKPGRDMRMVGSDPQAAEVAGISVDHTRVRAVVLSMVIACTGEVIHLQTMGDISSTAHPPPAFFAIPALIAGGASLNRIRIRHAFIGVAILHVLFNTVASKSSQTTLFFQQFVPYALIAVILIRYGMGKHKATEQKRKEQEAAPASGADSQ